MRNDILFAKRVIGIAACSSLSRKSWDDLCSKVIEPSLSKISKDKGLVVINGKSYQIEDISDNVAEELIMEVEGNEAKDFFGKFRQDVTIGRKVVAGTFQKIFLLHGK